MAKPVKPIKQPLEISFTEGLNLKEDPYRVSPGNFLSLVNSVFDKIGRLTKRNGFPNLTALPNDSSSYLTTFNDNLQALGANVLSYSSSQNNWVTKGSTYPIRLNTLPLIRNSVNQIQCDSAIAPNGLICTVYTQSDVGSTSYKYAVANSLTGQNIVAPTAIPVASGTVTNAPRVFLLGNNFIIVFENVITAVQHLQYVAISSITGSVVQSNTDLSASLANSATLAFDGVVANGRLYLGWNGAAASGFKMTYLQANLVQGSVINPDASHVSTIASLCADTTQSTPIIWANYYNLGTTKGYALAVDQNLVVVRAATQTIASGTILNLSSAAQNQINTFFYEVSNTYGGAIGSVATNFVDVNTFTQAGILGTAAVSARSIGLASKAAIVDSTIYYMGVYSSSYQPTYFLMNGSTSLQAAPIAIAKLAYQNARGYLTTGTPALLVTGTTLQVPYLVKDLVQAVNKNTNVPSGTQTAGIYSQTGINLATFNLDSTGLASVETGEDLHVSGGFLWMFDGYLPVEHNFLLYPDNVATDTTGAAGGIAAGTYYYQVVYEWADNQGNIFSSAPSIPVSRVLGSSQDISITVPTLRLTYKIANPLKIVIYRWSLAQQSYYQVTSISVPLMNSTTTDSVTFTDTQADAAILGNKLLYTTGGVLEDVGAPASDIMALFDNRLWLVDAEDRNLLWFSKEVVEGVPVEMSDLLTLFVAPTTGSQFSTGDITAIFPMDDKLIIFKNNAILYINGTGPNSLGAGSQYSQPIFVTSTVGCANPRSIAMTDVGLMFQSNKGIWLLDRGLVTRYIGAFVEDFNQYTVTSAVVVPGTNQVRFALNNGITLMYDYFVKQWGEFEGIPSVASTIYNDLHTIVNEFGEVLQESPGTYLDGSRPVLMSFTTSWLKLSGLRGYMRAYWFYLLGTYLSPHKLSMSIRYDYNSSPTQSDLIAPINYAVPYGTDQYYGGDGTTPYGGPSSIEQWQIFLERQRCKSFQISMQEVFDPSFGTVAGPGLTLSGLSCILGFKKAYSPLQQNQQIG